MPARLIPTLLALMFAASARAQPLPEFWNARPSTTGLPGEEVRVVKFAPDGKLWVAARWLLWTEGGIGIYDRATQTWTTYAKAPDGPLPSEFIHDIEFGPGGVVWIASRAGLTRFDGSTWTTIDTSNSPLLHNNIANIALDSQGHVWINNSGPTAADGAIFEFTGSSWRRFTVGAELPWAQPWDQLSNVLVDRHDRVWVSNETQNGLAVYDGSTWTLRGETLDRFDYATEDTFGNLWFLSNGVGGGGAVWKWDGSSFTSYHMGSTFTLTAIEADDDGAVYMGNWHGQVWKITDQGATRTLFATTGGAQVFNLAPRDPLTSDFWIGSIGAVRRHNAQGAWQEAFNGYNTGVPDFFIQQIHRGQVSNQTYLVTWEAGVSRFDGERWLNRGIHNPNLPWPVMADGANACYEDRAGRLWIGTNGIARWDLATHQFDLWDFRSNPELGASQFTDIAEDAAGNIFAFEQSGFIFRFNPGPDAGAWDLQPMRIYTPLVAIAGAESDSNGVIYASGQFELVKWDGQQWTEIPQPTENFLFDLGGTTCLAIGLDDSVWLGTARALVHYQDGAWTVYDTANSPLPASNVRGIAFRADGAMAVTAHDFGPTSPFPSGVCVIRGPIADPASWTIYDYPQPLPHYQLGDVEFDAAGDLWVSAISMGVSVLRIGETCRADLTGDGLADFADYLEFLNLFDAADPRADFNQDGLVDFADYLEFLNLYEIGC